ncbi:flagellar motor switch protein FliN [Spirochaeta lutea]|uniref:Flagellar motor switch protein FliN n=1 Tax=Spirochaeta lutea TaxID=1480694 RepID=A0A098R051_9SPIO|nr:flagellar motor switch protein FliN [Spirochaeta lutea]KGE73535.1 hypothetical protein DC28_02395 [Spirochaeta lutea]
MSDGSLSQDEIDALLQGSTGMDLEEPKPAGSDGLSDQQVKQFISIIQGTVDTQGSNFAMLLGKSVTIGAPKSEQLSKAELAGGLEDGGVQLHLDLEDGVDGSHGYLISKETALGIAGPMMGLDGVDLDDAAMNALQEAFSNLSGPVVTALSDSTGKSFMTQPPEGEEFTGRPAVRGQKFLRIAYPLSIEGNDAGTIYQYFELPAVASMLEKGKSGGSSSNDPLSQAMNMQNQSMPDMSGLEGWGMSGGGAQGGGQAMQGNGASVQSVQFPSFNQGAQGQGEQGNIGLLMDVYMEMTVELGRTKRLIKDILGMGEGTIIELDKLAGEPVDILVNHKLIARGEVVVIDENFGVRVTEIISTMERINNMT